MKKFKYGYDDLRKILITIGAIAVVSYFVIYVIGHWDIIATFLQSRSQTETKATPSQLRSKTTFNFAILILSTAIMAVIPFMSNAIFVILNGVVYGPGIGSLVNVFSNILGSFVFIKIPKMIDTTDNEKKLKSRFAGTDVPESTDFGIILDCMIPTIPTTLVSYYVAETKLSRHEWPLYITIGVAPNNSVYAFGGDAVIAGSLKRIVVLLVTVAVAYLVVIYSERRDKKKA